MSNICQGCGADYSIDFLIEDSIWEKIKPLNKPMGGGLLCPRCIGISIENNSKNGCYHVISQAILTERFTDIVNGEGITVPRVAVAAALYDLFGIKTSGNDAA